VSALTGEQGVLPPVADGPRSPECPHLWSRWDRRWDRVRYALIVGWLMVLVATPVTGERVASWGDLRALVAAGQIVSVGVSGELLAGTTGYGVVSVHWRRGMFRYTAEVVQVRGRGAGPGTGAVSDGAPVVHATPSSLLTALRPGLQVRRDQRPPSGSPLLGWQVPHALASFVLLLSLAGLAVLVGGPHPGHATRWAWFWLLVSPLASIVFLLLSGPTPGVPGPWEPRRRLTGGWAFLLAVPLASLLAPDHW
jgi:hypothetical protein